MPTGFGALIPYQQQVLGPRKTANTAVAQPVAPPVMTATPVQQSYAPPVTDYYSTPELQRARQEATSSQQDYQSYSAQSQALPDLLKEALAKKFSTNNPLYAQRESALQNYMVESERAPLSVSPEANQGMVFDPREQAAMIAGRRGAALAPITSLNEQLGIAYGGLDNIIAAATKSYQAIAGIKGAKAQAARQNLEDLLSIADRQRQQGQEQNVQQATKGTGTARDIADKTSEIWQNLVNNASTSYDVYKAIQANKTNWIAQGINVDQIWNNQRALETTIGKGGKIPDYLRTESPVGQTASSIKAAKEKEDVDKQIKDTINNIKTARQYLERSGSGAQYTGWQQRQKVGFGGIGKDVTDTAAVLSTLNARLFDVAGKAFTGKERALLEGIVLDITKGKPANQSALDEAERILNQRVGGSAGGGGTVTQNDGTVWKQNSNGTYTRIK